MGVRDDIALSRIAGLGGGRQDEKAPLLVRHDRETSRTTRARSRTISTTSSRTATPGPSVRGDVLAAFTGHGSRFVDDVSARQTVEPAIDSDAAAALAFALLATS